MDGSRWHTLFIALHAATATLAFAAGVAVLLRRRWVRTYVGSVVGMVVFLLAAVAVTWTGLDAGTRVVFSALAVLGAAVLVQAVLAARLAGARSAADRGRLVDRLGFTLISLLDGFLVVSVLNGTGSGVAAAVTGVGVALAGHVVLVRVRARETARASTGTAAPRARQPASQPAELVASR